MTDTEKCPKCGSTDRVHGQGYYECCKCKHRIPFETEADDLRRQLAAANERAEIAESEASDNGALYIQAERDRDEARAACAMVRDSLAEIVSEFDGGEAMFLRAKRLLQERNPGQSLLDELARLRAMEQAFERSFYDISPCSSCGKPVVCLPDGLPICEKCAKEVAEK